MPQILLLLILLLTGAFSAQAAANSEDDLVVYTYDSFMAKGGLGPAILPVFEKKCGCHVRALPSGSGGQLLARLELDAKRHKMGAHVIVGMDQHVWGLARKWIEPWGNWTPSYYSQLVQEARLEAGFLPYDYGALGFIADRQALKEMKLDVPGSLSELIKPQWKRNIILEDPRTSTPGLTFFLYTHSLLGPNTWSFWKQFRNQWLTLAPGWEGAYGLFLKKEAPLVWSYITSQAYHEEHGDLANHQRRFQALLFKEGQPYQIEGAAWVKGAIKTEKQKKLAKMFLEFLISPEVQKLIPRKIWMLPVRKDVELPESFKRLPQPLKWVSSPLKGKEIETSLAQWSQTVGQ